MFYHSSERRCNTFRLAERLRNTGTKRQISGKKNGQPISRVLYHICFTRRQRFMTIAIHLGRISQSGSVRPTSGRSGNPPNLNSIAEIRPNLVLLQAGFTRPAMLPSPRWALTSPFQPYQNNFGGNFLWHFPLDFSSRTLSGAPFPWRSDFPHRKKSRRSYPTTLVLRFNTYYYKINAFEGKIEKNMLLQKKFTFC